MHGITTIIASADFSNLGKSDAKKIVIQLNEANRVMAAPRIIRINYPILYKK